MEVDSANNDVFKMVKGFVILKVYMETILNTDFHLHWNYLVSSFDLLVWQQHCKISLFHYIKFSRDYNPDKVSNSPSNSVESLIVFFEVSEFKFIFFILGEYAGWF